MLEIEGLLAKSCKYVQFVSLIVWDIKLCCYIVYSCVRVK